MTVKGTYSLSLIKECLNAIADSLWFSKGDANAAYWQIKISLEDLDKTTFITHFVIYYRVLLAPSSCHFDPGWALHIQNTDSSDFAIGAEFCEDHDGC